MKSYEILPGFFISGNGFTREEPANAGRALAARSIEAVAQLIRRATTDYHKHWSGEYFWRPIPDASYIDVDGATAVANWVLHQRRLGRRGILVHCVAGKNRSGLVAALVVRLVNGCTGADAVTWVRTRRPGALTNPVMERWLCALPAPDASDLAGLP